jgi:hypothetical protein
MSSIITSTTGIITNVETRNLKVSREYTDLKWSSKYRHIDITLLNGGSTAKLESVDSGIKAVLANTEYTIGVDKHVWLCKIHTTTTIRVGMATKDRDLSSDVDNNDHVYIQLYTDRNTTIKFILGIETLNIIYNGSNNIIDITPYAGQYMRPWVSDMVGKPAFSITISGFMETNMYYDDNGSIIIDTSSDTGIAAPLIFKTGDAGIDFGSSPVFISSITGEPPNNVVISEGTNSLGITVEDITGDVTMTSNLSVATLDIEGENVLPSYHGTSSGVINGGIISLVGVPDTSALFNISDGSGIITDITTKTSTEIYWTGLTNQSASYIGLATYIYINSAGVVIYSTNKPDNTITRGNIYLGVLVHIGANPLLLTDIKNQQSVITHPSNQIRDVMTALGFLNVSGNLLSAPSTNLTFQKSSGTMFASGSNYINDPKNPHLLTLGVINTAGTGIFQYLFRDGSSSALTLQLLNPNIYDDGITDYSNPAIVPANQFTIQRVYIFTSNVIKIQVGQNIYDSITSAMGGIQSDPFFTESGFVVNGLLISYIIIREGTTDTSDILDCKFLSSGKFGSALSTAVGSISDLQDVYDNSLGNPQILTHAITGPITLRQGVADANNTLELQNLAGTATTSIKGDGAISASSLTLTGDLSFGTVSNNILPTNNNIYNVGSETFRYNSLVLSNRVLIDNASQIEHCFLDSTNRTSPSVLNKRRFKICNDAVITGNVLKIGSTQDNGSLLDPIISLEHTTGNVLIGTGSLNVPIGNINGSSITSTNSISGATVAATGNMSANSFSSTTSISGATLSATGALTFGSVNNTILPTTNNIYNIGSAANAYNTLSLTRRVLVDNASEVLNCFIDSTNRTSPSTLNKRRFQLCNSAINGNNILTFTAVNDNGSGPIPLLTLQHTTGDIIINTGDVEVRLGDINVVNGRINSGSILLNATTGINATPMNYYETIVINVFWSGLWAVNQAGVLKITRIGNMLFCCVCSVLANANTAGFAVMTVAMPARFRPQFTQLTSSPVRDNISGTIQPLGVFDARGDGLIRVWRSASINDTLSNFSGLATNGQTGWLDVNMSWHVPEIA